MALDNNKRAVLTIAALAQLVETKRRLPGSSHDADNGKLHCQPSRNHD